MNARRLSDPSAESSGPIKVVVGPVTVKKGSASRMPRRSHVYPLIITLTAPLFLAGCQEAGQVVSSLLGGFGGSNGSSSAGGDTIIGGNGSTADGDPEPGSVSAPEPTSLTLIGGGMAGLAYLRRRKKRAS